MELLGPFYKGEINTRVVDMRSTCLSAHAIVLYSVSHSIIVAQLKVVFLFSLNHLIFFFGKLRSNIQCIEYCCLTLYFLLLVSFNFSSTNCMNYISISTYTHPRLNENSYCGLKEICK